MAHLPTYINNTPSLDGLFFSLFIFFKFKKKKATLDVGLFYYFTSNAI